MDKRAILTDIIKCCETCFNRGSAADWKHSDFTDLSREILHDTSVNISPNTLKRIFGKIYVENDYLPQQATIDALEKYGGYVHKKREQVVQPVEEASIVGREPNILTKYKFQLIISAVLIVFLAIVSIKILKSNNKLTGSIAQSSIEGHIPTTVLFDVKLPDSNDSLFVNFGDKSDLVYVKKGQEKAAHVYLFPGVFNVKIQTRLNNLAIAGTSVYVGSDKWIGFGYNRRLDLPDHYYEFPALKTGSDSLFHIPNTQLVTLGLDTSSFFTRLCNFTSTGQSGDDFVFETKFKNELHEKEMYCHSTQFQISGMNSMIRFRLVSPGCSSRVINMVSEQNYTGCTSDLSKFVANLETWNTIKLTNTNKHLTLFVNGKLIFDGTYQKALGEIKGVFLEFEGNGFVKYCNLKTNEGKNLFHF